MTRPKINLPIAPGGRRRNLTLAAALIALFAFHSFQDKGLEVPAPGDGEAAPAAPMAAGAVVTGRVVNVYDGDTFTMVGENGRKIKVRLFGVDAPEMDQEHGPESGRFLRQAIGGQQVRVESRGPDQYGRLLGLVLRPDGTSVTYDLVAQGQVWVYKNYCDIDYCSQLRAAQRAARRDKVGLWAAKGPQPPWLFRKKQRAEESGY